MKTLYIALLLITGVLHKAQAADPIDRVAELFSKGNTHEIAKLFTDNVDMGILADLETYSKAQAEQQLQKFFAQNKPISAKTLHKVTSNAAFNLGVIALTTDKGVFRVSYTLKNVGGNMQLVEVRVEGEKR